MKERVELIQEHRPVEKEFVVSWRGLGGCCRQKKEKKQTVTAACRRLLEAARSHAWQRRRRPWAPRIPLLQVETRATGVEREVGTGEVEHLVGGLALLALALLALVPACMAPACRSRGRPVCSPPSPCFLPAPCFQLQGTTERIVSVTPPSAPCE